MRRSLMGRPPEMWGIGTDTDRTQRGLLQPPCTRLLSTVPPVPLSATAKPPPPRPRPPAFASQATGAGMTAPPSTPFDLLGDSWTCPQCKSPKAFFTPDTVEIAGLEDTQSRRTVNSTALDALID